MNRFFQHKKIKRGEKGFTFAELLAAMLFTAIVIPIALEGIAVANRASVYAERKLTATRLAERMLNEMVITDTWSTVTKGDVFENEFANYRWRLEREYWNQGSMTALHMYVFFTVQGIEYSVVISTLVSDEEEEAS